mgnify:CR=1 FL=1
MKVQRDGINEEGKISKYIIYNNKYNKLRGEQDSNG